MARQLFALLVANAVGCKGTSAPPPPSGTSAEPPPSGSTAAAPTLPERPPGTGDTTVVAAKHGACDVTASGDIFFESHAPNEPDAVLTDHWLTAATKAERKKLADEAAKRGESYQAPEIVLNIVCQDPARGVYIRFGPTLSKLADIPMKPASFPIVQSPEDKPGVMRAEVSTREAHVTPMKGKLDITKFEQGELAATFELEIASSDEPPKKSRLTGKLVYHCADHAQCGAVIPRAR
jgi:hypothetical protein